MHIHEQWRFLCCLLRPLWTRTAIGEIYQINGVLEGEGGGEPAGNGVDCVNEPSSHQLPSFHCRARPPLPPPTTIRHIQQPSLLPPFCFKCYKLSEHHMLLGHMQAMDPAPCAPRHHPAAGLLATGHQDRHHCAPTVVHTPAQTLLAVQ
jgi:hypothetical protein